MNDRYLYRAKRIDNGEWVEGYLFDDGFENGRMFVGGLVIEEYKGTACDDWSITGIDFYEVDPSTICQCTGLKDKHGNLIFENDLLECKTREFIQKEEHFITQVEWDSTAAGFLIQDSVNSFVGLDGIGKGGIYECEIIGNIFDSSDVLDGRVN